MILIDIKKLNLLSDLLKQKVLHISSAESITGGTFASYLTSIPGASIYFDVSLVTYSNHSKISILKVSSDLIDKYGSVSKQVANEMAKNLLQITNSNIAISFTGNAGPSNIEKKKIGKTYIAIHTNYNNEIVKHSFEFISSFLNRNEIIIDTINFSLNKLIKIIENF